MKKNLQNLDKPLLIVSVLLFIFGLIMVFSSSNVTAFMSYNASPYNFFFKQFLFLIIGLLVFFIMLRFNTKLYGMVSWLGVIAVSSLLVILLIVGQVKNQAVSWFDLGFFSIQPSEFAKVIMIVWMARYYEVNAKKLDRYGTVLFPLLIGGLIAFLIIFQPDLGTAIIFSLIVFGIFMSIPINKEVKRKIFMLLFGVVIIVVLMVTNSGKTIIYERQLERLNFTHPCERLLDEGSQVCNAYIAINNGGLTGVGLGNSTQKYLYLPEPYTDFIFAIIVEELGLIVGILLLLAYIFVLYRIIVIARQSYTNRGAVICYGVALYIFLHIAINLLGLFGLMPMTGVPLPFMSYGGSYTLSLIVALTMVQRVNIETKLRNNLKK